MWRPSLIAIIGLAVFASAGFAETSSHAVREANSLYSQGKYDEALKKYQAAQVESPADRRIMYNLGNAQYKLGQFANALSEYSNATLLEDSRDRAHSHYNAGNALYRMGKLEDAVEQYLEALKNDPNDEDAKYNLEFVRQEIRRRMDEQQKRQQEQKDKEKSQQDTKQQGKEDPKKEEQNAEQQQADQQKDQSNQNSSSRQGTNGQQEQEQGKEQSQQNPPQTEGGEQTGGGSEEKAQGQMANAGEQGQMSKENVQRWLDAVEAETAKNMKDFLGKRQSGQVVTPSKDW